MKLRISGSSIRIRLQQAEVRQLSETGEITSETRFPGGGVFRYSVQANGELKTPDVSLDSNQGIIVRIPATFSRSWPDNDVIEVEGAVALEDGSELSLLVEKDFRCLTPRSEDKDAYPHPASNSGHVC